MMPAAGLKTIIALSFVLAIGFLLVILSCALYKVYYPLLVVATYVIAPVPNWIAGRVSNPDDFVESAGGSGVLDLGRFCTGFLFVMGIGKDTLVEQQLRPCIVDWRIASSGRENMRSATVSRLLIYHANLT